MSHLQHEDVEGVGRLVQLHQAGRQDQPQLVQAQLRTQPQQVVLAAAAAGGLRRVHVHRLLLGGVLGSVKGVVGSAIGNSDGSWGGAL